MNSELRHPAELPAPHEGIIFEADPPAQLQPSDDYHPS